MHNEPVKTDSPRGLTPEEMELSETAKRALATYITAKKLGMEILVEVPHWRDDLYASRGGALLGYSAIMIAAALVYLSAAPDSFLVAKSSDPGCGHISLWALIVFLISSILSLRSIVTPFGSRKAKEGPVQNEEQLWVRLGKIEKSHKRRRVLQSAASLTALIGTGMLLYTLLMSTYAGACFGPIQ